MIGIQDEIDCECRPGPNPLWQHKKVDLSRQVLTLQRRWASQEWKWKKVYHNLRDGKRTEAPLRDLLHHFGPVGELHARPEQFGFELIGELDHERDTMLKVQWNRQDAWPLNEYRTRLNENIQSHPQIFELLWGASFYHLWAPCRM